MTRVLSEADPTRWCIDVPFVIGGRPLTSNDRLHWRPKADHVARIRDTVAWTARQLHIPPQRHITVGLHYAPGDNRRRDASNLMASQKPAIDGLVDAGIVPDDTAQWVTELMPVLHPTEATGGIRRLWLVIETSTS